MGGQIRWSFPVLSGAGTWVRGDVLELLADGTVDVDSGAANGRLKGLAIERRSPIDGRPEQDETKGSGFASLLLDESVFVTEAVESGVTISPNDSVYTNGSGKLTNAAAGPKLGKALSRATGPLQALTMFYSNGSV